jgi:hypothetical protein
MFKLLRKLLRKEKSTENTNTETTKTKTTTTNNTNACKKIEFYDRFIIIKNPKDNIIEATIEKIYYEDYEVEEITEKEKLIIDLPKCTIEVSLNTDENTDKNTADEIVITHIVNRDENIPFKVKIYTPNELKEIITEPKEITVDRFKLNIKQK